MLRKSWIAWFRLERAIFTVVVSTLFLPYFQIALHSVPSFNCVTISTLHHSSSLPQASASLRVCILFPFFAEISIVSYFYFLFCVRSFVRFVFIWFHFFLFISLLQILMPDKEKTKLGATPTEKRKADDIEIKDLKKVNAYKIEYNIQVNKTYTHIFRHRHTHTHKQSHISLSKTLNRWIAHIRISDF